MVENNCPSAETLKDPKSLQSSSPEISLFGIFKKENMNNNFAMKTAAKKFAAICRSHIELYK